MLNKTDKYLIVIASISITTLVLGGCASPGYQRVCDWCDDASQAQLTKDVAECNAIATNQVPDRSERRKTGRIVTSHGSTSCTTSKNGNTTCSTGPTYTYPEEETVDVTDYGARKMVFTECTDAKAKNYRAKVAPNIGDIKIKEAGQHNITQEKPVIGKTSGTQECKKLYQEWIFVELLEEGCAFNRGVAKKVGISSKSICPSLTEDQQKQWALDPMIAFKNDVDEFGINKFCSRNKSSYENLGK